MTNNNGMGRQAILVVDDEPAAINVAVFTLGTSGRHEVVGCEDSRRALDMLSARSFQLILLDLNMPHLPGEKLLPDIVARHPGIPVIVVTGMNQVETAVGCIKAGAFDYLVKPVSEDRLVAAVDNALRYRELQSEFREFTDRVLSGSLKRPDLFTAIVTRDPRMFALFQYIEAIAASNRPVLITGETGTGKELIAHAVHAASGRTGPFVTVNAAGLDDQVFADTLFGHVRGAFTGADRSRPGMVEQAAGGTLFLDEIGDLAPASQTKLLRLLQEDEYLPLGSDFPKRSKARVVTATNRDMERLVAEGRLRQDLFFRLRLHHIALPALRERLGDLPLLVRHLIGNAAEALGKAPPATPPELCGLLATYHFPGNVRELEAILFEAVSLHRGKMLSLAGVDKYLAGKRGSAPVAPLATPEEAPSPFAAFPALPSPEEAQRWLFREALKRAGGNQSLAARLIGVSQPTFCRAVKRYGL